ncbi:hypothetical protein DRO69_00515 [Candidatus Bathyarchaeota archaeon]|nr:MAG: hypothetical protein DRO69_00515 [Candidatus Bathyarchaeota archaeon]
MAKLKGNKIWFDFHETAWSRRTSGFPIWGIKKTEKGYRDTGYRVQQVGETQKKPFYIDIDDFLCIIRYYESFKGYVTLYIYYVDNSELKEVTVYEKENFNVPGYVPLEIVVVIQRLAGILMSGVHFSDIDGLSI